MKPLNKKFKIKNTGGKQNGECFNENETTKALGQ